MLEINQGQPEPYVNQKITREDGIIAHTKNMKIAQLKIGQNEENSSRIL